MTDLFWPKNLIFTEQNLLGHPVIVAEQAVAAGSEYNCVVIGDAVEEFSYKNLN